MKDIVMSKRPRDPDGFVPFKKQQTEHTGKVGGDTLTYNLAVDRRAREMLAEDRMYILQTLVTFRQSCAAILNRCVPSTHVGTFMAPVDDIIRYLQGVLPRPPAVDFNKKLNF